MKKSIVLSAVISLTATGIYAVFTVGQARGGMMGGGMMSSGMTRGNIMSNPGSEWEAPPAQAVRKNPVPANNDSIATGQAIFAGNCAYCHGSNGKGSSIAPDLSSMEVHNQTDGALFWKISEGKSPMPSFANTLTEHQRWDIINYIRMLASLTQMEQNTTTTTQPGASSGMQTGGMIVGNMMGNRILMMNSMGMMMSRSSMVPTPDGGVIVMMGNELLKYDNNLNLVKQIEISFDWNSWQQMMMQPGGMMMGTRQ
jgi:mono/diheme cytochrome c family protein